MACRTSDGFAGISSAWGSVVTMAVRLDDLVAKLPEKEHRAIRKRTAERIAEEATLRQLREARALSQVEMAEKLQINQAAVSKLERRTDMYLSTLRSYIEAMGGKLEIVACFPDKAVRIMQFDTLDPESRPHG